MSLIDILLPHLIRKVDIVICNNFFLSAEPSTHRAPEKTADTKRTLKTEPRFPESTLKTNVCNNETN